MRVSIILYFLAIFTVNLWSQQTDSNQQKGLDDIIVKETFQVGTEEEKLPVTLNADFSNLVEIEERIHWSSVAWNFEGEKPGFESFSGKMSSPELTGISPQPAKVFTLNFVEIANWKIDIFSSDGQKFRSLNGDGNPPKSVAWDGLGDAHSPLIPGESYAYSFTAIDRAGNKRTFPGSAFSVPALYLRDGDVIWVGISSSTLFSPGGFSLTRDADKYASEIMNLIYYFSEDGEISISCKNTLTDQFAALIANKLGKDISFLQRTPDEHFQDRCLVVRIK